MHPRTSHSLWFKHLDVVFAETNEQLLLTSSAGETSFVNESNQFEVDTDNDDEGLENEDDSDGDGGTRTEENDCCIPDIIQNMVESLSFQPHFPLKIFFCPIGIYIIIPPSFTCFPVFCL